MSTSPLTRWWGLAVILLFWCGLFGFAGTITSSYHLQDDHQILGMAAAIKVEGVTSVAEAWVVRDLHFRFRPFYFAHRVLEAAIFGRNLLAWSIYTALLAVLSSALLYTTFVVLGFAPLEALAFVFFSLVGPQGEVWWRRGPAETIGMAFLGIATAALAWAVRSRSWVARSTFLLSVTVMSLSKESFVLLIPAVLFALVWAVRTKTGASWIGAARACAKELIALLAIMTVELAVITLVIGTKGLGYAGIRGASVTGTLQAGWDLICVNGVWWVLGALGALSVVRALSSRRLREALTPVALFALVIVPQAALYAQSGLSGRYYLPGTLGTAFLMACCLRDWRHATPRVRDTGAIAGAADGATATRVRPKDLLSTAARRLSLSILVAAVVLLPMARTQTGETYRAARSWSMAVTQQQRFLDTVTTSCPRGPILISGSLSGIYEYFVSIRHYMHYVAGRDDVYFFFTYVDGPFDHFNEGEILMHRSTKLYRRAEPGTGPDDFECVGILDGLEDESLFLARAPRWFDAKAYSRQEIDQDPNNYTIYVRR